MIYSFGKEKKKKRKKAADKNTFLNYLWRFQGKVNTSGIYRSAVQRDHSGPVPPVQLHPHSEVERISEQECCCGVKFLLQPHLSSTRQTELESLSIYLSIYPSVYPSIYVSIYLSMCLSIYIDIDLSGSQSVNVRCHVTCCHAWCRLCVDPSHCSTLIQLELSHSGLLLCSMHQ